MKKKWIVVFLTLAAFVLVTPLSGFAAGIKTTTYWAPSKEPLPGKTNYSKWINKDKALKGPGTFKKTYTANSTVQIKYAAGIPEKFIKLPPNFVKTEKLKTAAVRKIPKNKKGQFQVRDVYRTYKVPYAEWQIVNGKKRKTGKVKYILVQKKVELNSRISVY